MVYIELLKLFLDGIPERLFNVHAFSQFWEPRSEDEQIKLSMKLSHFATVMVRVAGRSL